MACEICGAPTGWVNGSSLSAANESKRAANQEREAEPVATIRVWHKGMDQHGELLNWLDGMESVTDGEHNVYTTPQPQVPEWQPIETAPKDGTRILLCRVHPNPDIHIAISDGQWLETHNGHWDWVWPYIRKEPTHWMPLPAATKKEG